MFGLRPVSLFSGDRPSAVLTIVYTLLRSINEFATELQSRIGEFLFAPFGAMCASL
jgi:hypothetical protein